MALTSPDVVASLVKFISGEVSRRGITHLVPLESVSFPVKLTVR